jgi:hypothetical protein
MAINFTEGYTPSFLGQVNFAHNMLHYPEAAFFQEYLIYLTWQQVMAEPIPMYFQRGAELCDRYLKQSGDRHDETQVRQIRELRASFRAGLGLGDSEPEIYDEDTVKGGD